MRPAAERYLNLDAATQRRGKLVFAERCARCHSSKLPDLPAGLDLENANGPRYLEAWNQYWDWTKTDAFKAPMREIVMADDFLKDNFLSTELRVPSTLIQTNICSPIAITRMRSAPASRCRDGPAVGAVHARDHVCRSLGTP